MNEIAADQAFMTQHQQSIEDLERRLGDMDQVEEQTAHAAELEAHASLRAEKLELEAKYLNLQRFLESAGISKERLLLSPIREGRRRHTTGGSAANTPMKESSNNQTSVDVNFVSEQLAHANQRISQLESLLSELSNENSELLSRENRHQEDAEEMLRQQEALLSQVELYSSGAGIDQMPIDQLANVEERMQEALKKVQRQIMYAEFLAMHPELNKQPTTTPDGDKGESTPDEVIDPKIAAMQEQMSQLQAQLAEVRLTTPSEGRRWAGGWWMGHRYSPHDVFVCCLPSLLVWSMSSMHSRRQPRRTSNASRPRSIKVTNKHTHHT